MASGRRSGSDTGKLLQKLGDTGKSVGSQASRSATHNQNSGGHAPGFVSSASRSGGPNNHSGPGHHGGPGTPPPPPRPPRDHRPGRTYGRRSLGSYIASIIVLVVILVIAYIIINF